MPFLHGAAGGRLEILRTDTLDVVDTKRFPMSPVAVLPKVLALSALLICSAPSSRPDTDAISKVSAPKPVSLHCRRYFGCTPTPRGRSHGATDGQR